MKSHRLECIVALKSMIKRPKKSDLEIGYGR